MGATVVGDAREQDNSTTLNGEKKSGSGQEMPASKSIKVFYPQKEVQ